MLFGISHLYEPPHQAQQEASLRHHTDMVVREQDLVCASYGERSVGSITSSAVQLPAGHLASFVWTTLSDRAMEGDWRWGDGSRLTFNRWGANEPNGGPFENCVILFLPTGLYYDVPCQGLPLSTSPMVSLGKTRMSYFAG
jgi:hypothetical protein